MISKARAQQLVIERIAKNLAKMIPEGRSKKKRTVRQKKWKGLQVGSALTNTRALVVEQSIFGEGTNFWVVAVSNKGVTIQVEEDVEAHTLVDYERPTLEWVREDWASFFDLKTVTELKRSEMMEKWGIECSAGS